MEQFSRECLEIDTPANQSAHPDSVGGSSMDRVYDRAAKLVKRTLDVEGVTVMDVSHCEVLESMSAEGSVSVTMHYGEPGKGMTRRQLTTEEYRGLNTFFEKYPDGKVSEGIIPPSFKPFLPTHIQYALSPCCYPALSAPDADFVVQPFRYSISISGRSRWCARTTLKSIRRGSWKGTNCRI